MTNPFGTLPCHVYLRRDRDSYYVVVVSGIECITANNTHVGVPPQQAQKLVTGLTDDEANEWEVDLIDILGFVHDALAAFATRSVEPKYRLNWLGSFGGIRATQKKQSQQEKYWREHPEELVERGKAISESKMGHEVSEEARQKIAETLADKETADAAGLTVEEWLEIGDRPGEGSNAKSSWL